LVLLGVFRVVGLVVDGGDGAVLDDGGDVGIGAAVVLVTAGPAGLGVPPWDGSHPSTRASSTAIGAKRVKRSTTRKSDLGCFALPEVISDGRAILVAVAKVVRPGIGCNAKRRF
jgi:hypothetical protein